MRCSLASSVISATPPPSLARRCAPALVDTTPASSSAGRAATTLYARRAPIEQLAATPAAGPASLARAAGGHTLHAQPCRPHRASDADAAGSACAWFWAVSLGDRDDLLLGGGRVEGRCAGATDRHAAARAEQHRQVTPAPGPVAAQPRVDPARSAPPALNSSSRHLLADPSGCGPAPRWRVPAPRWRARTGRPWRRVQCHARFRRPRAGVGFGLHHQRLAGIASCNRPHVSPAATAGHRAYQVTCVPRTRHHTDVAAEPGWRRTGPAPSWPAGWRSGETGPAGVVRSVRPDDAAVGIGIHRRQQQRLGGDAAGTRTRCAKPAAA